MRWAIMGSCPIFQRGEDFLDEINRFNVDFSSDAALRALRIEGDKGFDDQGPVELRGHGEVRLWLSLLVDKRGRALVRIKRRAERPTAFERFSIFRYGLAV